MPHILQITERARALSLEYVSYVNLCEIILLCMTLNLDFENET